VIDRRIIASDSKELAIVTMIRVIEENQCCVFFHVEFAAMEKALTVKSGLSN